MDIEFTEEQELLRNSVQRLLGNEYAFDQRRAIATSEAGWSRRHWRLFAELGLLAAPFGEVAGGLGGGVLSTMIIMSEFGRHLMLEPFVETVVVVGGLIEDLASQAQTSELLRPIMAGDAIWTLAWTEPKSRYDLAHVTTTAEAAGPDYVLTGTKAAVLAAPWADKLLVTARLSGAARDRRGVSLFAVDRRSANLHLRSFRTIDGRQAAEVALEGVRVPQAARLGAPGAAVPMLEACRVRAIAALCAEAVGCMQALNEATLDYARTRTQFGSALSNFQVLQHRLVDMFIAQQEALSLSEYLCLSVASAAPDAAKLAAAAKCKIGDAAKFVAEQSVQIHGGMGMADELNIGHFLKRITAINTQFGDQAFHLAQYLQAA